MGNNNIEKIQMVLYILFLFLWFISSNEPILRIISIVIFGVFSGIQAFKIARNKKITINKSIYCYLAFSIWCFLSVIWAKNSGNVLDKSFDLICNSVFLVFSYDFFSNVKISKKRFFSIFIIVGMLFSLYVVNYYGIENYFNLLVSGNRVGTEIINVNFIGLIGSITFIIIVFCVLNGVYKNKILLLLSVIPLIISMGTGSKKVIINIIVGLLLILLFYSINNYTIKKTFKIIFISIIIILSFNYIKNSKYFMTTFNRFDNMIYSLKDSTKIDGSTYKRKMYIEKGLEYFFNYPITGVGLNNSGIITKDIVGKETYLHCNYVELLACVGIVGFILYYSIYLINIINYIKNRKKDVITQISFIMILIMLITEIGSVTYYEIKTSMYLIFVFIILDKKNWIGDEINDFKNKNI